MNATKIVEPEEVEGLISTLTQVEEKNSLTEKLIVFLEKLPLLEKLPPVQFPRESRKHKDWNFY